MARFSFLEIYKRFDIFGQGVLFNAEGKETVTSCLGATLSLLVTVITIAYAWTRLNVLLEFGDTTFQETNNYRGSTLESDVYRQSDTNFNIAFSMNSLLMEDIDMHGYLEFEVDLYQSNEFRGLYN